MRTLLGLSALFTTMAFAITACSSAENESVRTVDDALSTVHRSCGGFANLPCPTGFLCVDDPSDRCDPERGGADCPGICVAKKTCGGFGNLPCGGGEECVDDPTDDCDPAKGGADCPGICKPKPRID